MEAQETAAAEVSKAPGEAVTFDDMEAVMGQEERGEQMERQVSNEQQEAETPKGASPDDKQADPVDSEEEAEEPEEQESAEPEKEDRAEESDKVEAASKDDKIYKVSSGDSELEIGASTEFEVMVKGEPVKVPLQDLMNNYSGATNWNKKFSELNDERKAFEADRDLLNETVNTMYGQLVENKDWQSMLTTVAEAFGANPFEIIREVRSQVLDDYSEDLSDEEAQAKEAQREAEYWRNRLQRDQDRAAKTQKLASAQKQLDEVASKYGMDDKDIVAAYESLLADGHTKEQLEGNIELLGERHFQDVRGQQIQSILTEVSPDLSGEAKEEALKLLLDELSSPDIDEASLKEIIVEVYGSKAQKNIMKKVKKGQEVKTESSDKPKSPMNDPMFFDDIPDD